MLVTNNLYDGNLTNRTGTKELYAIRNFIRAKVEKKRNILMKIDRGIVINGRKSAKKSEKKIIDKLHIARILEEEIYNIKLTT